VKYVVELAKALSRHPAVHRVDLLTRLIRDPSVDGSYGEAEELLAEGSGGGRLGGARIVRIACGPTDTYIRHALPPAALGLPSRRGLGLFFVSFAAAGRPTDG
jgi:sucrose-phosphate synthase